MQQMVSRSPDTNALFAAPQPRSVDGVVSAYMKSVNETMVAVAGIRYQDVYKSLHGEVVPLDRIRDAVDRGVQPSDFVLDLVQSYGLKTFGDGMDRDRVPAYNRVQCALVEFSANSEEWLLSPHGNVYRVEDDGIAQIGPVLDRKSGDFGVGVTFREGAAVTEDGRLDGGSERVNVAAEFDVGEAVSKYEEARELKGSLRLG